MSLTLKKVNQAIQAIWPEITLTKGNGYFYIYSDVPEIETKICGLYTSSIGVYSVNHLSIEQWIESVKYVLSDNDRFELDRSPVFDNL